MTNTEPDHNYWYYNIGGREQGPVLGSLLRQMARKGKLATTDLVRCGKFGDWVEAGTVAEIGAKPRAAAVESQAVEALQAPVQVNSSNRVGEWVESAKDSVSDFFSGSIQAVVLRVDVLRVVASYAILAVVLVSLVHLTVGSSLLNWTPAADAMQTYQTVWQELKTHRENKADDETWNQFTKKSQDSLQPIIARLERVAQATNRDAQLLLWAGRDCLPKMLVDARAESSRSEHQFEEYLKSVEQLRLGQPIYGGNPGGFRAANNSFLPTLNDLFHDPLTVGLSVLMTVGNVAVMAWIGLSFWKSKRSSA